MKKSTEWHEGASWMLEAIIASLKAYPNAGIDTRIRKEILRIEREARNAEKDIFDGGLGSAY